MKTYSLFANPKNCEAVRAQDKPRQKHFVRHFDGIASASRLRCGSICELASPETSSCRRSSLVHLAIDPGEESPSDYHLKSEDTYYVLSGIGLITDGDKTVRIDSGDVVCIPPGAKRRIRNLGDTPLSLLVYTSPPLAEEKHL